MAARRSTSPNTRRRNRRGYYTSFIQTTATLGLLLSLIVILLVQGYVNGNYPDVPVLDAAGAAVMAPDGTPQMIKAFNAWGWRIPFLGSIFLLLISLYIRLQMNESPAFKKMKEEGSASKAPLREAFGNWRNGKIALIALLGLVAGQAVVWYSGQFYALFFLQNVIKLDSFTANVLVAWSLILGTGGFLFFGSLSDRIGRKPIILAGCLIAALTYMPVFKMLTQVANPALYAAHQTPVTVTADPADCSFQFNPTGTLKFTNSCDVAKAQLQRTSVNYDDGAGSCGQRGRDQDRRHGGDVLQRRRQRRRHQGRDGSARRRPRPAPTRPPSTRPRPRSTRRRASSPASRRPSTKP